MGKNTMMKRSIRLYCERTGNEEWPGISESLVGNVGLIFTKGDLNEVRPPPSFSCPPVASCCLSAHFPSALFVPLQGSLVVVRTDVATVLLAQGRSCAESSLWEDLRLGSRLFSQPATWCSLPA